MSTATTNPAPAATMPQQAFETPEMEIPLGWELIASVQREHKAVKLCEELTKPARYCRRGKSQFVVYIEGKCILCPAPEVTAEKKRNTPPPNKWPTTKRKIETRQLFAPHMPRAAN